jgi:hypothetical protein
LLRLLEDGGKAKRQVHGQSVTEVLKRLSRPGVYLIIETNPKGQEGLS